jgi:hypothetical protein
VKKYGVKKAARMYRKLKKSQASGRRSTAVGRRLSRRFPTQTTAARSRAAKRGWARRRRRRRGPLPRRPRLRNRRRR